MRRAILLSLIWTTLLCRPALADVGDAQQHPLLRGAPVMMRVTAYTSGPESTGKRPGDRGYGITSRGTVARRGVCAADPAIPFGTRVWIDGYGVATVEDRGGAIKGDRLDVWFRDVNTALRWGRQRVKVVVLE